MSVTPDSWKAAPEKPGQDGGKIIQTLQGISARKQVRKDGRTTAFVVREGINLS